jgi:hypothetical protein
VKLANGIVGTFGRNRFHQAVPFRRFFTFAERTPMPTYRPPRSNGVTTLKDAIDEMLKAYKLRNKFNETYLVTFWEQLMGRGIASRTGKLYVSDKKLYIQITSPPLKQELVMAKSKVIELINREMGETVVEDVIFI